MARPLIAHDFGVDNVNNSRDISISVDVVNDSGFSKPIVLVAICVFDDWNGYAIVVGGSSFIDKDVCPLFYLSSRVRHTISRANNRIVIHWIEGYVKHKTRAWYILIPATIYGRIDHVFIRFVEASYKCIK